MGYKLDDTYLWLKLTVEQFVVVFYIFTRMYLDSNHTLFV